MELVAYLHSEVLCERLQQGESIDQTLDCQLLDSIASLPVMLNQSYVLD